MPRPRRLDAPGAHHHVAARGVEKRAIFLDESDRHAFVIRLERLLLELGFACLAWALIPNHFHLLVRRDGAPLAKLMARLSGPFAQNFNRRHGRVGHLFQGRFVSRLIVDDADLASVAKYVLFNPVRHRVVSPRLLSAFPWCAYGAVAGARRPLAFERIEDVCGLFGDDGSTARALLQRELASLAPEPPVSERLEALIHGACSRASLPLSALGTRSAAATRLREEVSVSAVTQLGVKACVVARMLGVSEASIHRALARSAASQRKNGV